MCTPQCKLAFTFTQSTGGDKVHDVGESERMRLSPPLYKLLDLVARCMLYVGQLLKEQWSSETSQKPVGWREQPSLLESTVLL